MTLIEAKARATNDLVSSGEKGSYLKALLDGTTVMEEFAELMCFEGRVFSACGATVSTTQVFGAGNITVAECDLMVVVPANVSIIPLEIILVMEIYGTEQLFEFMAQIGTGTTTASTSGAAITPYNVNLGHPRKSSCTVAASTDTDAVVMTDNVVEFWRGSAAKALTIGTAVDSSTWQPVNYTWTAKGAGYYPICNGKGGLQVFASSNAGEGFIQLRYLELPSNWLS